MALADVYDALISKRVYKEAFTHEMARDIILKGRGTHFDPAVIDAFVALEQDFIDIAKRYSDNETDRLTPASALRPYRPEHPAPVNSAGRPVIDAAATMPEAA
jgi:HD-GYP domain-containing protein (c-di-GMP phosphodiesterase class II)